MIFLIFKSVLHYFDLLNLNQFLFNQFLTFWLINFYQNGQTKF